MTGAVAALWLTQPGAKGLAVLLRTELPEQASDCSGKASDTVDIDVWPGEDKTKLVLLTTTGSPFTILLFWKEIGVVGVTAM